MGCSVYINEGDERAKHRCVVFSATKKPPIIKYSDDNWKDGDEEGDKKSGNQRSKCLWVYDIEACLVLIGEEQDKRRDHFYETDENDNFMTEMDGTLKYYTTDRMHQKTNLVVYKQVFQGQIVQTKKTRDINVFIEDMIRNENDGHNIVIAHNASGYDSRHVFDALLEYKTEIGIVANGGKIMRLSVGPTVFQDSMLHLTGSLKSLANDYLKNHPDGLQLKKGYFPHLFNRAENFDYIGPIPHKKYFDVAFMVKDDAERNAFHEWYDSQQGKVWNFQEELEKYCENDVECLSEIVKMHHELCMKLLTDFDPDIAFSPWQKPTAAGYVHQLFLLLQTKKLGIHKNITVREIEKLAQDHWATLHLAEYHFCRKALRGGRTEIRKFYYQGPIKDLDIQSEYPYCQLTKTMQVLDREIEVLYPTGYPTIDVFDADYFPCGNGSHATTKCACTLEKKQKYPGKLRLLLKPPPADLHAYINNFFGFIQVDVTPPNNLYHPVLPHFDPVQNKCLFSLEPMTAQVFCSVELQVALRQGYKVTKIYRADRYKAAPSNWIGLLGVLYKLKLYNSQKAPQDEETRQRFKDTYKQKFDIDIDFNDWDKRPAAKKTGKILINSGWGKHAETTNHEKVIVLEHHAYDESKLFYKDLLSRDKTLKTFISATNNTVFKYTETETTNNSTKQLHETYLPAAVMVPQYGRLMVLNHITPLGPLVLMCDTDSIKYIDEPGGYDITEGDCLGDWENEGMSTEFVALCPKSYGQRPLNGEPWFKCKGVNLRRAHQNLFNFDIAKQLLFDPTKKVYIPQWGFVYKPTEGMVARHFDKVVKFDPKILKGKYNPANHQLYPFGHYLNSTF
jgi:hypothetical protein